MTGQERGKGDFPGKVGKKIKVEQIVFLFSEIFELEPTEHLLLSFFSLIGECHSKVFKVFFYFYFFSKIKKAFM